MPLRLTNEFVATQKPRPKPFEVADTKLPGLLLRVQPSGVKAFIVVYGRGKRTTLKPRPPSMTVEAARIQARAILTDADKGGVPEAAKARARGKAKPATLRAFIDEHYKPRIEHQKSGERGAERILTVYESWADKPISDLNPWVIEKHRAQRLKAGIAAGTVNRDLAALKAALAKGVGWKVIDAHPLSGVKLRKVENERIRFLDDAEESRLRAALAKRDREGIAGRARANKWRAARGYDLLPALPVGGFVDHVAPMVLVALNVGLRRGELTALDWSDVDLAAKRLLVRAAAAKSGKPRHVPLNAEARDVLTRWNAQGSGEGRVFNGVRDIKGAWLALMKQAAIEGFHFHDLRHAFASNLVMAKVDLNTVRELLGHADMKMTLRYAHLADEHKAAAVELLTRKAPR
jgi:integrase